MGANAEKDAAVDQAPLNGRIGIPEKFSEVTAEWLTKALSLREPGLVVTDVETLEQVHGSCWKVKLQLTYNRATSLPSVMWVKSGWESEHQERILTLGAYADEAQFYANVDPAEHGVLSPACYYAGADYAAGQGTLLLEDLDRPDIRWGNHVDPYSVDLVADGLASLARLHADFWESPKLDQLGYQVNMVPGSKYERHFQYYDEAWFKKYEEPVGAVLPEGLDYRKIMSAMWKLQPWWQERPFTLIHGDAHQGNTYIKDEKRFGFLDWGMVRQGPWAADVSTVIGTGLSIEDRRSNERDLLKDYLDRLRGYGVDAPKFDSAWDLYRRFYGYLLFVWMRNPGTMQLLESNVAQSARLGPAAMELEVLDLLGVV